MRKLNKVQIFVIVFLSFFLIGFLIYSNSFNNEFLWDDDDSIVNNTYIKDIKYFPRFFSENLIAGTGQITNYFRPILLISFSLDYQLFGLNPSGFHVHNTLLHIITACLIFILLYKLSKKNLILSYFPALIFLVHPLQTEAVTYIAGRADPLSSVLSLISLIFYYYYRERKKIKYVIWSLLAFILALLTKEQVILLPILISSLEIFFFFSKKDWKKTLKKLSPFFFISLVYFILRISILNFNDILSSSSYLDNYSSSLITRLLTFTWVINKYFILLFNPSNLHMAYEVEPVSTIFSWSVLLFISLITLFIILAYKTWSKNKLIAFGLLWSFIILLPRTNILKVNRAMYEHWLYLPIMGFFLAFFSLILLQINKIKNKDKRKKIIYIFTTLTIIFSIYLSYQTIERNKDWKDPITFYEKNLIYTPNSYIQRNNLAMAYDEAGRYKEAIKEYRQAISIADIYPQVHHNLANSLVVMGEIDEAKEEYLKAIEISPTFILPYRNLLSIYTRNNQKEESLALLRKLEENTNEDVYNSIAWKIFLYFKNYNKAIDSLEVLNKMYPNNLELRNILIQMKLNSAS